MLYRGTDHPRVVLLMARSSHCFACLRVCSFHSYGALFGSCWTDMSKSKHSKHKAPSAVLYTSSKTSCEDKDNSTNVESKLYCDRCTGKVDRLVQCEKCMIYISLCNLW